MNWLPSALRNSLRVDPLPGGRVSITVELPAELVTSYCQLLAALSGFFSSVQTKSNHALAGQRAADRQHDPQVQQAVTDYNAQVVALFDRYTAEGSSRQEAIKRIAADLRAAQHPWRHAEQIRAALVESGRRGRPGPRPSSQS